MINFSEPLLSRRPWFAALLFATAATPAGVVLAWLAPRPLDALVALPLVLVDMWAASDRSVAIRSSEAPILRLLLLVVGIVGTWGFYVLMARLLLWRLLLRTS